MDGVGPGSLIAGRYRVQRKLRTAAGTTLWQGSDETLDRPVSLRVVDPGHPRVSEVVDAARRAAGVEDSRLQRILDVGVEGRLTYLVTEWVTAQTMADLITSGSLPPEEVRRLVGEAASALEAARHRGLHHLALTPHDVLRSNDGPVTLTGLGVEAALLGVEEHDPAAASSRDAIGLVALIYAGLTGRWPSGPVDGLEAAPRIAGRLPAPSELAAGVPADLDQVCVKTLVDQHGPVDPGALAARLAPWPSNPVVGPNRAAGSFPLVLGAGDLGATTVLPAIGSSSVQAVVGASRSATAMPAPPSRPPAAHVPAPLAEPAPVAAPEPEPEPEPAIEPTDAAYAEPPVEPPIEAPVEAPVESAPEPADQPPASGAPGDPFAGSLESPAPLLPPAPLTRPPGRQTGAVLGVVVGFVLVLSVLAYCGLRAPASHGDKADRPGTGATTKPTASGTSSGKPSTTPSQSPSSTATASPRTLRIVRATGFDPQGDGSEDNSLAPRAYDGKKSTAWTSDTYRTLNWSGLKKGVGLRLDLGRARTVTSARVQVGGTGATVQLRAVNGDSLSGSTVLASRSHASGVVTLTAAQPTSTRYVVIWFSVPGQVSGGFRAEVYEVRLR